MAGAVAILLLGWFWGDAWWWVVARAVLLPAVIVFTTWLYAAHPPIRRATRVVFGVVMGGWCAGALGGGTQAVLVTGLAIGGLLLVNEAVISLGIRRDRPSRAMRAGAASQ